MCYWKRWRYTRTKVRNRRKLGTSLKIAIDVGLSRKGPWRLARTLATQTGMTNQWLKDQGLLSGKELSVNIHYSRLWRDPVDSVNRPVRTRMRGAVGAGGERPPATRLDVIIVLCL